MVVITTDLIMRVHHTVMVKSDKEDDHSLADSIRDEGCLPAIEYGVSQISEVFEKVAYLLYSIATRHPFVEGNKRTAFVTAIVVLRNETGLEIKESPENIYTFVKRIASGDSELKEIENWFRERIIRSTA